MLPRSYVLVQWLMHLPRMWKILGSSPSHFPFFSVLFHTEIFMTLSSEIQRNYNNTIITIGQNSCQGICYSQK